jgi:formate/nitrite transporter FocA (FNT family)
LLRRYAFLAGVLLGLSLVGVLFAAADDDTGQARALLLASGLAFALVLALAVKRGAMTALPRRIRKSHRASGA